MQETLISLPHEIAERTNKAGKEEPAIDVVVPAQCLRPRSQPSSRRVVPTRCDLGSGVETTESAGEEAPAEARPVEKLLKNGDLYTGGLSGGVPHGSGKYLWSDGCMYMGEWKRGKASGKGRFSWPSGATYEGDFKDGRMDGEGTFIGADGDSYRGHWLWGRKHGFGEKRYSNGDVYVGNWKANLQDGHGRYVWSEGNVYDGEWKNGFISGKGVLTWANGNGYEGFWEDGVPVGKGASAWVNGDSRHGTGWGKKLRKESSSVGVEEEMATARKWHTRADTPSRSVANFPRICIWELDGEAGDITCDIVDTVEAASMFSRDTSESDNGDSGSGGADTESQRSPWWTGRGGRGSSGMQTRRSPRWLDAGDVKKPGQTVTVGHKNYDLMLNLQLGIRYSVGKHASISRELRQSDFDPNEKFWTRFPPEGSKATPPHQSLEFKWKDYCPMVFRHLRDLFALDAADYMMAICGNETLREFSSPGKSGSFFYLTEDERFMIKTIKKAEVKVLIRMLPNYYKHVFENKNTLVTKFFGLHCVKPVGGQKTRFIVMGNLFCSDYRIHKRFDLKGSSHGRTIDKPEGEIDETTTLKDLDLNYVFRLESSWYKDFIWQINSDCEFLEAERIMDYSLLIGLHFRDKCSHGDLFFFHGQREMHRDETSMRGYRSLPNMDWIMEDREPLIRLGANTPATAERVSRIDVDQHTVSGSTNSTPRQDSGEIVDVILYFGIIDILQDYDITKKLEHAYRSLQVDSTSISAVDPKLYAKRFRDFIQRIFLEDKP